MFLFIYFLCKMEIWMRFAMHDYVCLVNRATKRAARFWTNPVRTDERTCVCWTRPGLSKWNTTTNQTNTDLIFIVHVPVLSAVSLCWLGCISVRAGHLIVHNLYVRVFVSFELLMQLKNLRNGFKFFSISWRSTSTLE